MPDGVAGLVFSLEAIRLKFIIVNSPDYVECTALTQHFLPKELDYMADKAHHDVCGSSFDLLRFLAAVVLEFRCFCLTVLTHAAHQVIYNAPPCGTG